MCVCVFVCEYVCVSVCVESDETGSPTCTTSDVNSLPAFCRCMCVCVCMCVFVCVREREFLCVRE